jgi:hypothetical protein
MMMAAFGKLDLRALATSFSARVFPPRLQRMKAIGGTRSPASCATKFSLAMRTTALNHCCEMNFGVVVISGMGTRMAKPNLLQCKKKKKEKKGREHQHQHHHKEFHNGCSKTHRHRTESKWEYQLLTITKIKKIHQKESKNKIKKRKQKTHQAPTKKMKMKRQKENAVGMKTKKVSM